MMTFLGVLCLILFVLIDGHGYVLYYFIGRLHELRQGSFLEGFVRGLMFDLINLPATILNLAPLALGGWLLGWWW